VFGDEVQTLAYNYACPCQLSYAHGTKEAFNLLRKKVIKGPI